MRFKNIIVVFLFLISIGLFSQNNGTVYKAERVKKHDLIHTKLNVNFDFFNSEMNGEAWITAKTHFKPTSKISLDAKAMLIHTITINNQKVDFNYFENKELIIELDKEYKREEEFTIYIKYTARPEKYVSEDREENADKKGLYFIDPREEDTKKPTQIWTEGQAEFNSVWFPTIDAPNQKSTQELLMTVPQKYATLSNGSLISQTENADGTRTDYWKQDQKHAPYLFFMAVGAFSIVEDTWKGKPVRYYVEAEYEDVARDIFGKTPEMLSFYEDILGVAYPWDKYSQIVVRDYVSGAMENTTAVAHSDSAYQSKGSLLDKNSWEGTIAHEIIHHWFGDFVTAESWSNIAMNEAFANYGEYLWFEHAYGTDYATEMLLQSRSLYFDGDTSNEDKDLIRFDYMSSDEMFDGVSYEKGGAILHMLRNFLGDDVFFEGLKKYLNDHKFGTGESHQLRLALESVSGLDLNWFFNQWFFNSGHPNINVTYDVGGFNDIVTVNIHQKGKPFNFPLTIDVYEKDGRKSSHRVWVNKNYNTFTFSVSSYPKLVNVDPHGVLLAEITHKKTLEEAIYQYGHSDGYIARKEALEQISGSQENKDAFKAMTKALGDKSFHLRILALEKLDLRNKYVKEDAIKQVFKLANTDAHSLVRAAANVTLAKLIDPMYISHFKKAIEGASYKVMESGIVGLYQLDQQATMQLIKEMSEEEKDYLAPIITGYFLQTRDEENLAFVSKHISRGLFFVQEKKVADAYMSAFQWVAESSNIVAITNLVNSLVEVGKAYKKQGGADASINFLRQIQYLQKNSTNSNKKELEGIVRAGMAQLVH
jgi:aminopeptidase N